MIGAFGKAAGGGLGGWGGAELGMFIGTLLAPGVGTAIGGAVGGSAWALGRRSEPAMPRGEALGSDWEVTMQSGDNRAAVEASAVKALQKAGQAAVEEFFVSLKNAAIMPVDQRAARLVASVGAILRSSRDKGA